MNNMIMYTDSHMTVRTKRNSVVGVHVIETENYAILASKHGHEYKGKKYSCKSFEILENGAGQLIVRLYDDFRHVGARFSHEIVFSNVTDVEISTEHDI